MTRSRHKISCIFCEERGQRAREDVTPKWLARELGGQAPFAHTRVTFVGPGSERAPKTSAWGSLATQKLRDVCRSCNSNWMSDLETGAKLVLLPMVRGERSTVDPQDQQLLARWAQVKAIALDAWHVSERLPNKGVRHLPETIAHAIYERSDPLPNGAVLVGTYQPMEGSAVPYARWHQQAVLSDRPVAGVGMVFAFGHLFLKILFVIAADKRPVQVEVPTGNDQLFLCWPQPIPRDLDWPLPAIIPTNDFSTFT